MAAGGTPGNVDLGAGRLYYAPLGTTEPVSCSATPDAAWIVVGYTEDGSTIETDITSEAIEVAEELDPVRFEQTSRRTKVGFQMAEPTKKRLALALGAGAAYVDNAATFEFPDGGDITAIMLLWDSDDTPSATNRRWLFRRCTPTGTQSLANKKAPSKRLIPVMFDCAKPDTTTKAVKVFPNSSGQV